MARTLCELRLIYGKCIKFSLQAVTVSMFITINQSVFIHTSMKKIFSPQNIEIMLYERLPLFSFANYVITKCLIRNKMS